MQLTTLATLVKEVGPPTSGYRLSKQDAEAFHGRVPDSLITFWTEYGFGSYAGGYFTVCDPRPFGQVLSLIFQGDPQLGVRDMTVVGYTGDGEFLYIWHRDGRKILLTLDQSLVNVSDPSADIDPETGLRWSADELIGAYLSQFQTIDTSLFEEACILSGRPGPGEVFGLVPAFQLGGSPLAENMRRVKILEYISFIAQLGPFRLIEMSSPSSGYRFVRNVGPQT